MGCNQETGTPESIAAHHSEIAPVFNAALRWSRVGDWIWWELKMGRDPAEIKRRLTEHVDELDARKERDE